MIELTVQLSNEVAARLAPVQHHLPHLLQQIAQSVPVDRPAESTSNPPTAYPIYNEMLDFLVNAPSPQEIIDFKASTAVQSRLGELLIKNRESTLTESEQAELDAYEQVEHIVTLLKAKAYAQLRQ
jgi:hypothetical protein